MIPCSGYAVKVNNNKVKKQTFLTSIIIEVLNELSFSFSAVAGLVGALFAAFLNFVTCGV
jgi:hypothetical protein